MTKWPILWIPLVVVGSVLFFSSILSSASLFHATFAGGGLRQLPPAPVERIDFELHDNLIFLPVQINDSSPLSFILDSGADSIAINQRLAATLGLKTEGHGIATGWSDGNGAGGDRIAFVKGASVRISGVEFRNQRLAVVPLDKIEPVVGHSVSGVLGSDIFKRFVVEIDYTNRRIGLFEPRTYIYSGKGTPVPITIKKGLPGIPATVAVANAPNVRGKFLIDTGGDNALFLFSPFVAKHFQASDTAEKAVSLQVGSYWINSPATGLSRATRGLEAGTPWDGEIGSQILCRFNLVFDYSRKILYLEPNDRFRDPSESSVFPVATVRLFQPN